MKLKSQVQENILAYLDSHNLSSSYSPASDHLHFTVRKFGTTLLIHFPPSSFLQSRVCHAAYEDPTFWHCFSKPFHAEQVALMEQVDNDDYRTPRVRLMLGTSLWVEHQENHVRYTWDLSRCMFSCGNITEKQRIAQWKCDEEIVVDLFAGIGYFTLTYLLHAKAKHVFACEWNPAAVEALRKNLVLNKITPDRCTILEGDNTVTAPVGVAQRVNLGLIPTSQGSWRAACRALDPRTGGYLHVHGNVDEKEGKETQPQTTNVTCNKKLTPAWLSWGSTVEKEITELLTDISQSLSWSVSLRHVEHVKSYGPRVDHLVADILCKPEKQLNNI